MCACVYVCVHVMARYTIFMAIVSCRFHDVESRIERGTCADVCMHLCVQVCFVCSVLCVHTCVCVFICCTFSTTK